MLRDRDKVLRPRYIRVHQHSVHCIFNIRMGALDNPTVSKGKLDRLAIKNIKII